MPDVGIIVILTNDFMNICSAGQYYLVVSGRDYDMDTKLQMFSARSCMRKKPYKLMFFSFGRLIARLSCIHNGNEAAELTQFIHKPEINKLS